MSPPGPRSDVHHRTSRSRRAAVAAVTCLLTAVSFFALPGAIGSTDAAWRDSEFGQSTFVAGLGRPVRAGCTPSASTFTARWGQPTGNVDVAGTTYEYRVRFTPSGGTPGEFSAWITTGSARQFTYQIPASLVRIGSFNFEVRARVAAVEGPAVNGNATVLLGALGLYLIGSCTFA